jgi:hypothetical protein
LQSSGATAADGAEDEEGADEEVKNDLTRAFPKLKPTPDPRPETSASPITDLFCSSFCGGNDC